MASKRKSWREKLTDSKDLPRIQKFTKAKSKSMPAGIYVIPAPIEVDAIMKKVPKGKRFFVADFEKRLVKTQ